MTESSQIAYIVDDDDIARDHLGVVLSAAQVSWSAADSAETFLLEYDPQQSGCLLLDVQLPGMTGLELQAQLKRSRLDIPIIFVAGHAEVSMAVDAFSHGAFGFLQKPVDSEELLPLLRKAFDHDTANRAGLLEHGRLVERFSSLTPREQEVLRLLVAGRSNKAMANDMLLSQRTVELYRARVMEKTGSSSLAQLVRMTTELQVSVASRVLRRLH